MSLIHHKSRLTTGWSAGRGLTRVLSIVVALIFSLSAPGVSAAQLKDYEVKAAFVLNFAKFVEWPTQAYADADAPLVIGIVGDDPFEGALSQIVRGQTAQGRRIEVRYFKPTDDIACHLLFISRSEAGQTAQMLERVKNRPVLTVSDQENFLRQGGMIDFVIVNETVRFDINARAIEKSELKASSKLLAVARTVKT